MTIVTIVKWEKTCLDHSCLSLWHLQTCIIQQYIYIYFLWNIGLQTISLDIEIGQFYWVLANIFSIMSFSSVCRVCHMIYLWKNPTLKQYLYTSLTIGYLVLSQKIYCILSSSQTLNSAVFVQIIAKYRQRHDRKNNKRTIWMLFCPLLTFITRRCFFSSYIPS